MATITDVAKAAGVSVATVSRVMNGSDLVAETTARTVRETIERLGYVPNLQARNLRKNESRNVLVLLPNITNPYYSNVFSGINERAVELGYTPYLCSTDADDFETILQQTITQKRADGAILMQIGYREEWLQKYSRTFPVVQCCEYTGFGNTPHVSVDNYQAGYEATEYLTNLGYTKIGTIGADNQSVSTIQRLRGFRDAMKEAGLTPEEKYMTCTDRDYSYPASLEAAHKLLSQEDRPQALFCISDSIALAAVVAAKELGLQVPEDLSIVGFDDVIYTQMIHPYLTTVVQPCRELGVRAMDMVHEIISEGKCTQRNVTLPHGFVERESTVKVSAQTVFSGQGTEK